MADKRKKLSDLLNEQKAGALPPETAEITRSRPGLIAKKSLLVDMPASIIGLGGMAESALRAAPYLPIPGWETPEMRDENVLDATEAAQRFAGLAENQGWLPPHSLELEPRGLAERAAGVGTRVLANPLTYLPGARTPSAIPRNVMGALAGESAAEAASAAGKGGVAQTGLGFAADSALMMLAPRSRAGFMVNRMNLGQEGAVEAADALERRLADLKRSETEAWRRSDQAMTGTTMPGDVVADVKQHIRDVTADAPSALRPEVATTQTPEVFDIQRLQQLRSAARSEADQAMRDAVPKEQIARHSGTVRETADAMIDVIAQLSPADADAVAKLKVARASSKSRAEMFPRESALYRSFFGGKSRDNAQEAVASLLTSPQRRTEITRVMRALEDTPSGQRGFRRAFVQAVLALPEEAAGKAGLPQLRKLDRFSDVSSLVLGKAGAKQLRKRLAESVAHGAASDATLAMARMAGVPWQVTSMLGGGMAALGAAAARGADLSSIASAGATGAVMLPSLVYVSEKFGPRAAREAAFEALIDPTLHRTLTVQVGNRSLPAYIKDIERAVISRGLHLGLPDNAKPQEPLSLTQSILMKSTPKGER